VSDQPEQPGPDRAPPPVDYQPESRLHVASSLAAVGMGGSSLVAGMMAGLLALDLVAWSRGAGFSGQSLIAGALLGSMALAPGLACWAAGRKLMRTRGDETLFAPRTARLVATCLSFLGAAVGYTLGFPS
jgi:hypothetical protein